MRVWRLARPAYPALDGEGARLSGGRWNSPGIPVVYASGTLSLAVLELLVHTDPDLVPDDLRAFEIEVPGSLEVSVLDHRLPRTWREVPAPPECRALGDGWAVERRHAVLDVPSVAVPEERNYLINPAHPAAAQVKVVRVRDFSLDKRLR